MKSKKIFIIFIIGILTLIVFSIKLNAAVQVTESGTRHAGISVNKMFENCYNMRYQGSTLGNNSLDPHLCNARDWGAMWYMGMSTYGSAELNNGTSFDGTTYKSVNGNKSGVMYDFSTRPSIYYQAAINSYPDDGTDGSRSHLYADANKKYVDKITGASVSETLGMALQEVKDWNNGTDYFSGGGGSPVLYRTGSYSYPNWGGGDGNYKYRPVIWN